MRENALKGLHTGGLPPLGFDVDKQIRMLVLNEKEASVVRLIFRMFNEGSEYDIIIRELNLQSYETKVGGIFGHNSIHNIVRNEKYRCIYF